MQNRTDTTARTIIPAASRLRRVPPSGMPVTPLYQGSARVMATRTRWARPARGRIRGRRRLEGTRAARRARTIGTRNIARAIRLLLERHEVAGVHRGEGLVDMIRDDRDHEDADEEIEE